LIAAIAAAAVLFGGAAVAATLEWQARPIVGANEVPPVQTGAAARASFELEDGAIHYKIKMRAPITGAFMAHIHLGAAGANGPIAVWLLGTPPPDPSIARDFGRRDTLARGEFDGADIVIPGLTLEALIERLDAGTAYVNVHTLAHPSGEIRAQIVPDVD
jgi:hypothetical protein